MSSKRIISTFIALIITSPLFSLPQNFSLSLTPKTGFSYGKLGEYIYNEKNSDQPISYLEWNFSPLYLVGLDTGINYKNFSASLGFDYALPLRAGKMIDHDFSENGLYETMLSYSELYSEESFSAFLSFSYSFKLSENFSFSPVTSLYYNHNFLKAKNGYGWYSMGEDGWLTSPDTVFYPSGKLGGANLTRDSLYTFAGLQVSARNQAMALSLSFQISPYTFFYSLDHHYNKKTGFTYKEIQHAPLNQALTQLNLDFFISSRLTMTFCVSRLQGFTSKGELYSNRFTEKYKLAKNKTGANETVTKVTSGIKINL